MKTPSPHLALRAATGNRLRESRLRRELSIKDAADALSWSFARLQGYEVGKTCPNVDEISLLAGLYAVDAVWLAFGDIEASSRGSAARYAQVPCDGGEHLLVPEGLLAGTKPPYRCLILGTPAFGMRLGDILVYRPGDVRTVGLHVAVLGATNRVLLALGGGSSVQWMGDVDAAPLVLRNRKAVLGIVVATMRRLPPAD